jgi:hypothetical protein
MDVVKQRGNENGNHESSSPSSGMASGTLSAEKAGGSREDEQEKQQSQAYGTEKQRGRAGRRRRLSGAERGNVCVCELGVARLDCVREFRGADVRSGRVAFPESSWGVRILGLVQPQEIYISAPPKTDLVC